MSRTVEIAGRTFASPWHEDANGCRWVLSAMDGWDNSGAGVRRDRTDRPTSHGSFRAPAYRTGRSMAVSGRVFCPSGQAAAEVVQSLNSLLADGSGATLTVSSPYLPTMTATVQLADMPVIDWAVPVEVVSYALELWADDPLRYGEPISASASFPTPAPGSGLVYPLFDDGHRDFGDPGESGLLTLTNVGTADVWPTFQVEGPVVSAGFDIVDVSSGRRVRFKGPVPSGSALVVDVASGTAVLDGVADRSGLLTIRDVLTVPAGGTAEFSFLPLGGHTDAVLTAVIRPGWW